MLKKIFLVTILVVGFIGLGLVSDAAAESASALDARVKRSIKLFEDTKGSAGIITSAKGLLVFPRVVKAGFGIGGEFGEGALLVDGKTEGYYNTVAASFGFQIGAQKKTIILAFMKQSALDQFLNSSGWEIGADASVAVIAVGADGSIDTTSTDKPIIAFVFDQKGLMYNLTLEGAKITKINK